MVRNAGRRPHAVVSSDGVRTLLRRFDELHTVEIVR
jgi:hypothetical protein